MSAMIKMVVVLSLLCGMSGFALSYLKMSTAERIVNQELTFVQSPAIATVYPYADNDPVAERATFALPDNPESEVMVFPFKKDGKLIGVALENFGVGYAGDLGVMVGFNLETNNLIGIGITITKETPGFGSRVGEESYTKKFKNIPSEGIVPGSEGGPVDALAGATISSNATIVAIQKATNDYNALKDQILAKWN